MRHIFVIFFYSVISKSKRTTSEKALIFSNFIPHQERFSYTVSSLFELFLMRLTLISQRESPIIKYENIHRYNADRDVRKLLLQGRKV